MIEKTSLRLSVNQVLSLGVSSKKQRSAMEWQQASTLVVIGSSVKVSLPDLIYF